MSRRKMGGEQLVGKSWAQLRQEAGWLGFLAISLWVNAAIVLLVYGGILSAIFAAIAGLMAWTPSFIDLRAQGKRTLSDRGRVAAGLFCLVVSGAAYPSPEKAQEAPASPAEIPVPVASAELRGCTATDRAIGKDVGVTSEGSVLRTEPTEKARYVMFKAGDEEVPHPLEASTLIREECRSGTWSRVRILAPSEFRHVAGWVATTDLVPIKTSPDGRRIYRPADFTWNPGSTGNHAAIVAVLNAVLQQNPTCDAFDTSAMLVSDTSSNPTVNAICVGPRGDQQLSFRLVDAQAGVPVKATAEAAQSSEVTSTLSKVDAFRQCQQATLGKLNHPGTANFNGWDTTFEQTGSESRFSVGLTAKSALGLELKLLSTCVFEGDYLTLNHIAETR